jgi:hypothetical protein
MTENPYQPPAPFDAALADDDGGQSAAATRKLISVFRALLGIYVLLNVATGIASFAGEAYLPQSCKRICYRSRRWICRQRCS